MFKIVEDFASRQPTASAVDDVDGTHTYSELDRWSSRLAVYLQDKNGVGKGVMVMLCVTKTRWAIMAMLAINKSGGCFVPCDPDQPVDRRQAMAAICRPKIAITSPEYEHLFSGLVSETVVISAATVDDLPSDNPPRTFPCDPKAPAYCFFTSGSTGLPKGCLGSNSALAALVHQLPALHLTPKSRVLQFAKFGFGITFIEIFCTLSAGGTVCIPSDQERMNALSSAMNRLRVNWALLTPTMAGSLHPQHLPTLEYLFLGGEPPSEHLLLKWMSKVSLFQVYGTTEMAGVTLVTQQITSQQARKTIGVPSNSRVWLTDPDNHNYLAPIGAIGELIIEGPSLAEEYLGNPERTDAAFIGAPSWRASTSANSSLLYKTGDLVRYNEDGSLSLVGRIGTQVKLRGQRLELEDVECELARLLREAELLSEAERIIATVIEPAGHVDRKTLVAVILVPRAKVPGRGVEFLEVNSQILCGLNDVRQQLGQQLPNYAVPQLLLVLADLPRLPTGKADRRSLQRQLSAMPYDELRRLAGLIARNQMPQTNMERVIHSLVCDALHVDGDDVGMRDDFFHLGGNSMIAVKLVAAAKRQSLKMTVADIFEHPILIDLASVVGQSIKSDPSAKKPFALLETQKPAADIQQVVAVQLNLPVSDILDVYPCTPLQEGLMALAEKRPLSYRARILCHLKPNIQIDALQEAWETVVERNDILRTRLVTTPSQELLQVVIRESFPWDNAEDRESYLAQIDQVPMTLGTRLVYGCILHEPNGHIFVLTLHHSICDRWSVQLLLEQLQSLYLGGTAPPRSLFSPFIQYIQQRSSEFEAYWKARFRQFEAQIFPPLPGPDFTPATDAELRYQISIPPRIARSYTISNHIRLSWALVLAHNTAVDDVVFGETLNGRGAQMDHDAIEQIVGPVIATVPQRIQLNPQQSIVEALTQVQEQFIQMAPYEQAGLQNIRRMGPEAEVACMFQNHLVIQPAWRAPSNISETVQDGSSALGGFASYALALECHLSEDESQVTIIANFDTRVLGHARVQRLLQHLDTVLQSVVQEPYQRLSDVPRLSHADLDQIYTWNAEVPEPSQETIHGVVRRQAGETPSAPAIFSWDGEFTYAELEHRSNQVAWELLDHGVQPGNFIAILCEKSKWTTIAMLGVNKAAAAFVLMDPGQPLQRLSTIAREAACNLVVCTELTHNLGQNIAPVLVVGDQETQIWNHDVDLQRLPRVQSTDIAYAVFTSGSTGTPKGTLIEHGSYCTAAKEFSARSLIDRSTRMLQFASYSFDACIGETFGTLMVGGCVCVLSENDRQNALARAANDAQVTMALLTPSVARLFRHEDIPSLKVMSLMGEGMRAADFAYWSDRVHLINGYGPTECSVGISFQSYQSGIHVRDIGRPRAAVAWIVDPRDYHRLMPVGAVGELLLEGPPVARGYLNNPEQTAKSFIEAPAWIRALPRSHRIYKTGDLVHYNEDGSLRFVGRANNQIKLRGQRLEPGEVETQLRGCWVPEPGEVAVDIVAPLGDPDRMCLAAFIAGQGAKGNQDGCSQAPWMTPDEGFAHRAAQAELRLQQNLPYFMVPSIFVPLQYMPRMASGKIDRPLLRRQVESYSLDQLGQYHPAVAPTRLPSTSEELLLQEIWAQVLKIPVERVGVDDNFFRLGGDSITGMQVVVQGRTQQLEHSLADIFQYKTIAAIAKHAVILKNESVIQLEGKTTTGIAPCSGTIAGKSEATPHASYPFLHELLSEADIPVGEVEDVYPCAPVQRGILLVQAKQPAFYHVAFTWEIFDATLEQVKSAIRDVIARHPIFRSCLLGPEPTATSFIQVVLRNGQQSIPIRPATDIEEFPGDFQPDSRHPSRFSVYHDGTRVFVRLDISHALWDGITSLVVERDLGLACHGRLSVVDPPRFRDYISFIQEQDQAAATGFWKTHLAHFDPCYFPQLAYNASDDEPGVSQSIRFELENHSAIGPFCRQNNITAPNVFCLAWSLVLRSFTGMDNVCFGNVVTGREHPLDGVTEMAGPLLNFLPFRVNLEDGTVSDVLQKIYSDYASSVVHQTCSIADIPHPTERSPMSLFNTQISIRRDVPAAETGSSTRLLSIKSPSPQEQRVAVYVVMGDERTTIEIAYWSSTISTEQASLVQAGFCTAVSHILANAQAPATSLDPLYKEQKDLIWSAWSPQELQMREIWARVLNVPPQTIGLHDDFFHIGGNSISAIKVISLARRDGIKIRLAEFLSNSKLSALVRML
ncbi:hypothetical protein BDV28DRAFT_2627 [Aspergillus coremiiformis]|uniref:Carrier domain-containing protein n=1 Tax=Aspergillus coremiiformis TaxID=138285 RepID=A0A5N6ZF69_9EURO|nr:hypothetical protein BDV28DRAFT_2627 [Aspergillus coremiiformis]